MTYTTEWEAGQCFEKKLSREKAQIDCAQLQNKAQKWYKQFSCSFHQILLFLICFMRHKHKARKNKQYCSKHILCGLEEKYENPYNLW